MTTRIEARALRDFAAAIFRAAGIAPPDAEAWAETLVWANLRGVDSHGVLRIPRYLELLETGAINPRANMTMRMQAGAIGLLDADRAPGPVAMNRAMDEAIAIARRLHLGWVVARDITHAGAVGHFALRAAEQGMAGLVMTASGPLMAWPGSAGAVVSTNPLAIAIPAAGRAPLLLDMSTAAVALPKQGGERRREHAGQRIGRSARREAVQHGDRPIRIGGLGGGGDERAGAAEQQPAGQLHSAGRRMERTPADLVTRCHLCVPSLSRRRAAKPDTASLRGVEPALDIGASSHNIFEHSTVFEDKTASAATRQGPGGGTKPQFKPQAGPGALAPHLSAAAIPSAGTA